MSGILIDTSIIIDFLRRKDRESTLLFKLAKRKYQLYASVVTYAESYAGKSVWEKKQAMDALKLLFSNIKILLLEEETAKKAGKISAQYSVDIVDAIIAATALVHKLTLATLNVKDFEKIKEVSLLIDF